MTLQISAKFVYDEMSVCLTEWSSLGSFTITLTPRCGRQLLNENYATLQNAMERYTDIVIFLHKSPYNWTKLTSDRKKRCSEDQKTVYESNVSCTE